MLGAFLYDTSNFSDRLIQIQSGVRQARDSHVVSRIGLGDSGNDALEQNIRSALGYRGNGDKIPNRGNTSPS